MIEGGERHQQTKKLTVIDVKTLISNNGRPPAKILLTHSCAMQKKRIHLDPRNSMPFTRTAKTDVEQRTTHISRHSQNKNNSPTKHSPKQTFQRNLSLAPTELKTPYACCSCTRCAVRIAKTETKVTKSRQNCGNRNKYTDMKPIQKQNQRWSHHGRHFAIIFP